MLKLSDYTLGNAVWLAAECAAWSSWTCMTAKLVLVFRYHTGPGFFINSYLIFAAINATVWVYLLLALTNSVTYPCGPDGKETCSVLTSAPKLLCWEQRVLRACVVSPELLRRSVRLRLAAALSLGHARTHCKTSCRRVRRLERSLLISCCWESVGPVPLVSCTT